MFYGCIVPLIKAGSVVAVPAVVSKNSDHGDEIVYASIYMGALKTNEDKNKLIQSGRKSQPLGITGGFYIREHFSVEAEYLQTIVDFDRQSKTLLPNTTSNKIRINSNGLLINTKFDYRVGRIKPFVGAGIGYFTSGVLKTVGDSGKFGGYEKIESSMAHQYIVGVDIHLKNYHQIEIGYRKFSLEADFGEYIVGHSEIGGDMFSVGYKYGGF